MLKYVSPGDEITAEGFNSIVDAIGGPDIPSQKGFLKTGNGALFQNWSNLDAQANLRVTDVFKCAVGPAIRTVTTAGPWDNWNVPRGGEPEPTLKHIYMYLGADNLKMSMPYDIEKNPFLNFNGFPPKYIAWSLLADNHIVSDKDFYINNLDNDFDGNGVLNDSVNTNIYHGWIETPFEPVPGAKIYGAFYKLLDSSGEGKIVGTIFILTYTGVNPDTATTIYPIHSFTTFNGPNGEKFIVGEQCSTPVIICEMQEAQAIPGSQDATMESSKLVQHHTGPISYQAVKQDAQGAWSILNFVSDNEDGEDITIDSYWEMKLSHASGSYEPLFPDFQIKVLSIGKTYLYVNNFQVSGKQVVIELDSDNPIRRGILSKDDFPEDDENAKPFINICNAPVGELDITQFNYEAYLVIPQKLSAIATLFGITCNPEYLRGVFMWSNTLKCWELLIGAHQRMTYAALNDVLLAEARFDGTGTYTWFFPRNAIFQGSFSNLIRDWNIGDAQLALETDISEEGDISQKAIYNSSIEACNILSAVDEEDTPIYEPTESFNELSDAHPLGLQLFRFDKMNYTTPLSVGLTSAEISAEWIDNMDVVVRHRKFDQNDNQEGFKGSVIKYVPIKDFLSSQLSVYGDTDITQSEQPFKDPYTSSIETKTTEDGTKYLQLYDFKGAAADYNPEDIDDFHGDNGYGGFVVRQVADDGSMNIAYMDPHALSNLISSDINTDTQLTEGDGGSDYAPFQKSIDNKNGYLELYQFNGSTMFNPTSIDDFDGDYDAIIVRRYAGRNKVVDYMKPSALSNLINVPNLSALNGLSVVTGIEYNANYEIEAKRAEITIVNNNVVVTPIASQTIPTIPHSQV